jgi:signal peptide peptidase SppA
MECQTYWAVRKETLGQIARVMSGKIGDAELRAQVEARLAAVPDERPQGAVAVVPLRGLITARPSLMTMLFGGGGGLQAFRQDLRAAVANDDVDAVLLDVDSPGGSTDLLTETAAEIRAAGQVKPVVAVANTMAASAAYWLASQASELVVTPSGEVGSLGVFAVHEDWTAFNEKFGVNPTYVSYGAYKTELNPDEPLSEEGEETMQEMVDEFGAMFVNDVAKGRKVSASKVKSDFGQGRMMRAQKAVEAGMADRVDTYERTLVRLASPPQRTEAPALVESELERPEPVAQEEVPDGDKPDPNGQVSEEDRARIAELVLTKPTHL